MEFPKALPAGIPLREWEHLAWANGHTKKEQIHAEAAKIADTVAWVKEAVLTVGDSPFFPNGPKKRASAGDIIALQDALQMAVPETDENKGLYAHLRLTGRFAHEITRRVNVRHALDYDAYAQNAAGNLHDAGKLTGVFRYHLNDLVTEHMLRVTGASYEVRECFPQTRFNIGPVTTSDAKKMGESELSRRIAEYAVHIRKTLAPRQEILILADVCGKVKDPASGEIQTFEEMEEKHMSTRRSAAEYEAYIGQTALWPSEKYAYKHLPGLAEGWLGMYRQLREKWKSQGADVDEIRKQLQDG